MNQRRYDAQQTVGKADHLWQELWTEAKTKPWLLRLLGKQGAVIFLRFRAAYERLQQMRPGQLRRLQHKLGISLTGAALLVSLSGGISAAGTAPESAISVDGTTCTLAAAITNANNDDQSGSANCAAGSSADTLTITNDIDLTSVLPDISTEITIEGGNHTVSGNNSFRILRVNTGASLTLNEATISGGSASFGGGIYNQGALTVQNSTLSGNSASSGGGINNRGALTVTDSTLCDNSANFYSGGGIFNWGGGRVMIENTTLSGNSGIYGGGIDNGGSLTLQNSTLSSNVGGGIANWGTLTVQNSTLSGNSASTPTPGGGIFNSGSGDVTVQNSTISDNSADIGGGIYNNGMITVQNSTISGNSATNSGNGGGIYNRIGSMVTVQYSIVANSVPGGDCVNNGTAIGNYSLIEDNSNACGLTNGAYGSIVGSDPNLSALADNGGPTQTHALVSGSPAIDAVPSAACNGTDQRGVPRNQDGDSVASSDECDIGAVEAIFLSARLIDASSNVEFTWSTGLDSYQLWRSENPYDNYALFEDNLPGPSFSTPIDPAKNYYYELHGLMGGTTVHISRRIGVSDFTLVPGSS